MNKILLIFLFAALISCSNNYKKDEVKISFDLNENVNDINSSGLINDYNIVKLQLADNQIVSNIDHVLSKNNLLYIADLYRTKTVYIYDNNGNFINKINRYGKANNEYIELSSIFYDDKDNTINLLSRYPSRILKFSHNGDSLLNIINIEKNFKDIVSTKNGYIGYCGNISNGNNHNLWHITSQGKATESWIEIPEGWESSNLVYKPLFHSDNDNIYYISNMDNILYKYDGNEFSRLMEIDFNKYNWPKHIVTYNDYKDSASERQNFVNKIDFYYETDKNFYFYFLVNGQQHIGVYDKIEQKKSVYQPSSHDDKFFIAFGDPISFTDGKLITSIEAERMELYLTGKNEYNDFSKDHKEQIERLQTLIGDVEQYDSPILLIYNLK